MNNAVTPSRQSVATKFRIVAILLLGLCLRIGGLNWGLPTAEIPHTPFHPDETWAINVLQEIHPAQWDFNPDQAHREGTLVYYIWTAAIYAAKKVGYVNTMPWHLKVYDENYAHVVIVARLANALLDTLSIYLIFAIGLMLRSKQQEEDDASVKMALWAALLFAITPCEIVNSHFMRTHAPSNFFALLTIFFGFRIYYSERKNWSALVAGIAAGFSFAARYPVAVVGIVPAFVIAIEQWESRDRNKSFVSSCWQRIGICLRLYSLLGLGLVVGILMSDPYIALDPKTFLFHMRFQLSFAAKEQFSLQSLLNFSRLKDYLTWLIPYGAAPYLWVLFYAGTLFVLFYPRFYRYTLPLFAYGVIYFYGMGKGYLGMPWYIRAVIAVFPLFALFAGIMSGELLRLTKKFPPVRVLCTGAVLFVVLTTTAFDIAYVSALRREDPRIQLYRYLQTKGPRDLVVGLFPAPLNYFVISPVLDISRTPLIKTVTSENLPTESEQLDYVILPAFEPGDYELQARRRDELLATSKFQIEKTFENPWRIFGYEFRYDRNPHDLVYPFPHFILLRKIG